MCHMEELQVKKEKEKEKKKLISFIHTAEEAD